MVEGWFLEETDPGFFVGCTCASLLLTAFPGDSRFNYEPPKQEQQHGEPKANSNFQSMAEALPAFVGFAGGMRTSSSSGASKVPCHGDYLILVL